MNAFELTMLANLIERLIDHFDTLDDERLPPNYPGSFYPALAVLLKEARGRRNWRVNHSIKFEKMLKEMERVLDKEKIDDFLGL